MHFCLLLALGHLGFGRRHQAIENPDELASGTAIPRQELPLSFSAEALATFLLASTPTSRLPIARTRIGRLTKLQSSVRMDEKAGQAVTILGGSGFVGSRVCKLLVEQGAQVVSVSKSGKVPADCAGEPWAASVDWRAGDLTRGSREDLLASLGSPDAVVSCVGSIGFDVQGLLLGNGVANVEAARAAKNAGAKKFVYVSVASEVEDSRNWLPAFFKGYFDGKAQAEAAIAEEFGESGFTFVKPTFIYGGDSFGLFPPRVNTGYGSGVEELLSSDLIQKVADALPGLIKVALRPPVSVDAVASACSAAVLGNAVGVIDGTAAINAAAGQPAATGLTDLIAGIKEKISELTSGN